MTLRHKGQQAYTLLTINGRVRLCRVRWHSPSEGSRTLTDTLLDEAEHAISEGVREMACRLNRAATSFQQTAENLARAAHLSVSKETLRQLIEQEGRQVLKAQRGGTLAPAWEAGDCRTDAGKTRVYLGSDGVMVPLITDQEKETRRLAIRQKRKRRGRRCRALPPRTKGADQAYKEFKIAVFYDEQQTRRYTAATSGDHAVAGRLMQRMATQVRLGEADEKIANVDGAPWIRNEIELHGLVDALGLDYYHLRENVQRTRLAVFGDKNPQGKTWSEHLMGLFYEQGCDAAWDHLVAWRSSLRGTKRAAADQLLGYVARAPVDDPLSGVSASRLADWERPDRSPMQGVHATPQRAWPPLGSAQCRGRDGIGLSRQQPRLASVLVKPGA